MENFFLGGSERGKKGCHNWSDWADGKEEGSQANTVKARGEMGDSKLLQTKKGREIKGETGGRSEGHVM